MEELQLEIQLETLLMGYKAGIVRQQRGIIYELMYFGGYYTNGGKGLSSILDEAITVKGYKSLYGNLKGKSEGEIRDNIIKYIRGVLLSYGRRYYKNNEYPPYFTKTMELEKGDYRRQEHFARNILTEENINRGRQIPVLMRLRDFNSYDRPTTDRNEILKQSMESPTFVISYITPKQVEYLIGVQGLVTKKKGKGGKLLVNRVGKSEGLKKQKAEIVNDLKKGYINKAEAMYIQEQIDFMNLRNKTY